MAGHSPSEGRRRFRSPVAVRRTASLPLAYVPAIHVFLAILRSKTWMPGTRPGMTEQNTPKCLLEGPSHTFFIITIISSPTGAAMTDQTAATIDAAPLPE